MARALLPTSPTCSYSGWPEYLAMPRLEGVWQYFSGESLPYVSEPDHLMVCLAPRSGSTSYRALLDKLINVTNATAPPSFPRCHNTSVDWRNERPCRRLPDLPYVNLPDLDDDALASSTTASWLRVAVVRNPMLRYPSAYEHYLDPCCMDELPEVQHLRSFE